MSRSVPEWIGSSDDAAIPPRVQLRIFERHGGHCACGCGIKIRTGMPWCLDHITALCNGGQNRERNLHPLLLEHHIAKTKQDLAIKRRSSKIRAAHYGIQTTKRPIPGSKASGWKHNMDGTWTRRKTA